MIGRVRSSDVCDVCHGAFKAVQHPLVRDTIDLMCPRCRTRPRNFYVDGRGIRDRHGVVGRLKEDRAGQRFDSFLSAYRTLETIRKEIDEHRFDSRRWSADRVKEMKLSRACEPWLEHLEREYPGSDYPARQREFLGRYIIPVLGDADVRDIRGIDIEDAQKKLLAMGRKPNSVRNYLTALRTLLRWLVKKDVIGKAPSFPKLSAIPRENVGWIEREEQAVGTGRIRPDMALLVEAMQEAGARPGEAVAWIVDDLKDDGGIHIRRALTGRRKVKPTKTGEVSWKAISPDLYVRLKTHAKGKFPKDWLFVNRRGKPYPSRQVSWEWCKAVKGTPIDGVCLSVSSRHSRVSQLRAELERRIGEEMRAQLAHTSTRTTMKHYARDGREKHREQEEG